MWTDWGTEGNPSGWKSLDSPTTGGCDASHQLGLTTDGDYGLDLTCYDNFRHFYRNGRGDGPNGGWSGWTKIA